MRYLIVACKEIRIGDEWYLQTAEIEIEAENKVEAEWQVRHQGYSPLIAKEVH